MKKIGRAIIPNNKGVHFPIEHEIVIGGLPYKKTLEKDAVVRCVFCNDVFRVNEGTAFEAESFKYLECPLCGKFADVVYYFDREIKI